MEPKFQVETAHNEDAYKNMLTVHYMRHQKNKHSLLMLYAVCVFLGAVVWYFSAGGNYTSIRALGAGIFVAAVTCILAPTLDRFSAARVCQRLTQTATKAAKKNKIFGLPTRYRFYDDRLDAADNAGCVETPYSQINDLVETKDYFLLFAVDGKCVLIRKSDFTLGTPEDFSAFIGPACGRKLEFFEMPQRRR